MTQSRWLRDVHPLGLPIASDVDYILYANKTEIHHKPNVGGLGQAGY